MLKSLEGRHRVSESLRRVCAAERFKGLAETFENRNEVLRGGVTDDAGRWRSHELGRSERRSGSQGRHALHFVEDGLRGGRGIGSLGNGATDHEKTGTGRECGGGGRDTFLVADLSAGRTNARDHEREGGVALAQSRDFFGAGDEACDAGGGCGVREAEDLVLGRVVDADGGELELIHAGEDGDGEQLRRVGDAVSGFDSGFEHGGATGGVDGEKFRAQGGDGAHSAGNGVGNVVELEVKKDGEAAAAEFVDDGVACDEVELETDFEPATQPFELIGESEGGRGTGVIEGDDQPLVHDFMVT